jgi:hypothetical protein
MKAINLSDDENRVFSKSGSIYIYKTPTVKQSLFLKEQFGIDDLTALTNDEYIKVYDELCEIEVDEVCKLADFEPMSEIGAIAVGLVTHMGNNMQFEEGNRYLGPF